MLEFKNTRLLIALVASLLLAVPATAGDAALRLSPLQDGDLAAAELLTVLDKASLDTAGPQVSREAVSFTFPLTADNALAQRPVPFEAASREYYVDVTAQELRVGATIYVTAKNAVVRINPAPTRDKAAVSVHPADLVLRSARGSFDKSAGMSLLAGDVDMAAMKGWSGVPFAKGTTAFRLAPAVGVGAVTLQAPSLKSQGRYQIHVFDVESPYVLGLRAQGMDYLHGQTLHATAELAGADKAVALGAMEAYVTSPAGRAWPVSFRAGDSGAYSAQLPLDALEAPTKGLWELHVAARGRVDGLDVIRSARTAFGVHLPTAGLAGDVVVRDGKAGLLADFALQVASPGRYEVRGVLFGTDGAGKLRPVAVGHSADWLAENGSLRLAFDRALLEEAGVRAPFEIRDVRLMDQGRMGVLHRQAVGLVID